MDTAIRIFLLLLALSVLLGLYFLPTIVALRRGHEKVQALGVLNLLAGWTFLGWVGAMVWAFMEAEEGANRRGFAWLLLIPLAPILAFEFWGAANYRTFDPCVMAEKRLAESEGTADPEMAGYVGEAKAREFSKALTGVALTQAGPIECVGYILSEDQ